MFKKVFIGILIAFSFAGEMHAQKFYWVFFTDKNGTTFDPYSYFAPEAISRRQNLGISLYDSTDFPVNENYIAEVSKLVDFTGHPTRWFNGLSVEANSEQIAQIQKLPFVREVVPQQSLTWKPACAQSKPDTISDEIHEVNRDVNLQIDPLKGRDFSDNNLKGNGIIISIIDIGFHGVDVHPAFASLRFNNRIRATFDFSKDRADVYSSKADHGTMVLSCIAGVCNGIPMGLATESTFLLAKIATPWTMQPRGEENFVLAMEWSDKQGAMLINCSDGPDYQSYFPEQMDGKIPLMSRASNLAARKGILVIAAAGNEGESSFPVILPPADADSVLSVTALNDQGYVASYSSIGPLPDFRRKPDVCAPGTVLVANGNGTFEESEGTSFSSPLLAGFAACVIQLYPDLTPMMLLDTMRKCSSLYPYYDYAHGFGVPQASYFFDTLKTPAPTFIFERDNLNESIKINPGSMPECNSDKTFLLFYALEDEKGRIYKYEVVGIRKKDSFLISSDNIKVGVKLHVFFQGYYATDQL